MRNPDSVAAARSEMASGSCSSGSLPELIQILAPYKASNDSIAKRTINSF